MGFYRKKPVVIEAHPFTGLDISDSTWIQNWCGGTVKDGVLHIPTLEGVMQAQVGDMIIKGVAGEFYPCKPEIFNKTYEVASK